MSENVESENALQSWDDEIFADFLAGPEAKDEDELASEDGVADAASIKNALAVFASGAVLTDSKASPETSTPQPARASAQPSMPSQSEPVTSGLSSSLVAAPTVSVDREEPEEPSASVTSGAIKPATIAGIDNAELAEAFLEDASRGIAALDQAVIDYESNVNREQALGQIGREIHTLKGAAGVVGLADVSRYLHDVEDFLQEPSAAPSATTDVLLDCLDMLRAQISCLANADADADPQTHVSSRLEPVTDGEDSISVKGEQLDRLLDMLTALAMLNNQRDTQVEQLREIHANLNYCGSRIRDLDRMLSNVASGQEDALSVSNPLSELANDLGEIGQLIRDAYSPMTQEHGAISSFIRQFRNALVSILRTPVKGMFRRLQRVALDAARVERKQVRLQVIGSDAGLERSVQERLLDPLMHIVRNAVSHGIEAPEVREKQGKDPCGTITLEAISAPNLLTLNIRDDGRGLDYQALRRRGSELGLLKNSRDATPQELGQLIFHRGFSTREHANEVAGRGVGMDVVADTLEKMHAWVDVESVPNEGTTIKMSVPLKSITEHALIVRIEGHFAAIAMQYVKSADDTTSETRDTNCVPVSQVMGIHTTTDASAVVRLEQVRSVAQRFDNGTLCCLVDEILGPQEVVVRPLPPLLRHQKLFAGITLSSSGQVVFVLDPVQLATVIHTMSNSQESVEIAPPMPEPPTDEINVLVVDDSLSARKSVAQLCQAQGWNPVLAQNGADALEVSEQGAFAAVITDFDMPQMDGLALIQALRAKEAYVGVPILMVSSRPKEEMEGLAIEAGATAYLSKPLRADRLNELFFQINS